MTRCECGAQIGGSLAKCPLCGAEVNADTSASPCGFPAYERKHRYRYRISSYRNWRIVSLVMAAAAVGIVNICVGGRPWSLYAIIGIFIFYQAFLSWQLVESNLIRRILTVIISVCVLLTLIQGISSPGMKAVQIIIPILLYSSLFVSTFLYFANFRSQKSHILPIIYTILLALAGMAVGASMFRVLSWPIIVLLSLVAFLVVFSFIFYRQSIKAEIKKKLHRQ